MIKKILLVIVVIILAVLAYAATKPDTMVIERSMMMNASAAEIFPLVNDFHNWPQWSPYEKLDPDMKRTLSGSEKGVGAVYTWEGNSDVGSGRMEITESTAPTKVDMKLDFTAPMEANNTTAFHFVENGGATNVTWRMEGPQNYMMKVMCIFVNMDKLIGADFETGLANMKAIVEAE